jgi:lia operon protein LiaG
VGLLPGSPRSIMIDSGSGGVTLSVPMDLDATFELEAGSGGIDILVPHEVSVSSSDHVTGRFGTGKGRIHIESGSGGVKIVPSAASTGRPKGTQGKS